MYRTKEEGRGKEIMIFWKKGRGWGEGENEKTPLGSPWGGGLIGENGARMEGLFSPRFFFGPS